jgi:hypothetical protein
MKTVWALLPAACYSGSGITMSPSASGGAAWLFLLMITIDQRCHASIYRSGRYIILEGLRIQQHFQSGCIITNQPNPLYNPSGPFLIRFCCRRCRLYYSACSPASSRSAPNARQESVVFRDEQNLVNEVQQSKKATLQFHMHPERCRRIASISSVYPHFGIVIWDTTLLYKRCRL